jgi:hypothetical protein
MRHSRDGGSSRAPSGRHEASGPSLHGRNRFLTYTVQALEDGTALFSWELAVGEYQATKGIQFGSDETLTSLPFRARMSGVLRMPSGSRVSSGQAQLAYVRFDRPWSSGHRRTSSAPANSRRGSLSCVASLPVRRRGSITVTIFVWALVSPGGRRMSLLSITFLFVKVLTVLVGTLIAGSTVWWWLAR